MIGKSKKVGKYLLLGIMVVGCIGLAAAKSFSFDGEKDAQIEAFVEELDSVSKEMAAAIADDPTTAGIANAQKALDARKDSLKDKFNLFKEARGYQVSQAVLKKLTDSITNNGRAITDAFSKNAADYADDPEAVATKFQALMKSYMDIFKM